MRRKERQVTDLQEILGVIGRCDVCRLGLADGGQPYVVPLNFGWECEEGKLTLFFHSAKQGRKLEMIGQNPCACFEMDGSHRMIRGEHACDYSFAYESVIGTGRVTICESADEKRKGLTLLMRQMEPGLEFTFSDAQLASVAVLRLDVAEFACKRLS